MIDQTLHILMAKVVGEHLLEIEFSDGITKTVDVNPLLTGRMFEPITDPQYFARVTVDPIAGTVVWPNGADIAPEALYELEAHTSVA
jgi:hypothetical protein